MHEQPKILCVDDEVNILRALRRLLLDEDYEILIANSGEEALELLEKEYPVHLILSDYRMPGMNGVDFLKRVCERWPKIIRIVLSGYADTASIVSAINEGQIYKFIPKPWNDDELKVTIAKAFEVYFLNRQNEILSDELRQTNEELSTINQNLEQMVRERSADILLQNKALRFAQNVLHFLPAAVLGIDLEGMIALSNRLADEILAREGSSLTGLDMQSSLPSELCTFIADITADRKLSRTLTINGRAYLVKAEQMDGADGHQGKIVFLLPSEQL
ncbi:MAG: response regulator [Deltaproteobacteria bacterium]|nr:response regulator [Deltaproteobacteria bacterium]